MKKYLFKALLKDNTVIEQTEEDKSQIVADKNAFYDVIQRMDDVRAFALYNQETNDEYLVDLNDLHFEVNQVSFKTDVEIELKNIRIVYFMRNAIQVNLAGDVTSHNIVGYSLGWQGNDEAGNNIQRSIFVS